MRFLFFILFMFSYPVNSAEFLLGQVMKSSIETKETRCNGYSVLVKEDRLPYEAEGFVPEEIALSGFWGSDTIIGARAFVSKQGVEYEIPISLEKYKKINRINSGSSYIPGEGYCLNQHSFLLSVWSGGNCRECEMFIKYQIDSDGKILELGLPTQEEFNIVLNRK